MVCIVCFGEECEFSFICHCKHEASCYSCLKVYLAMNVHKIFQNISFHCTFCYETVSTAEIDDDGILAIKEIKLSAFGIKQNDFPTHTGVVVSEMAIQRIVEYAIDQYAFDLLKGIALSQPRVIDHQELFNAFEYFGGLRNMIQRSRLALQNETNIENMKVAEISMIESSIIIITNEINALDALWPATTPPVTDEEENDDVEEDEDQEEEEEKKKEDEVPITPYRWRRVHRMCEDGEIIEPVPLTRKRKRESDEYDEYGTGTNLYYHY